MPPRSRWAPYPALPLLLPAAKWSVGACVPIEGTIRIDPIKFDLGRAGLLF